MCCPGSNVVTRGVKARPGALGASMCNFWPSAISPSTFDTVEFHRVKPAASVSNCQTRPGLARITLSTRYSSLNVVLVFSALALLGSTVVLLG
jgi:hypothetical protein